MHIFGTGPLEAELRHQARGEPESSTWSTSAGSCRPRKSVERYGSSLALLLPSIEEQFGNVVPEAQGTGLPVILSDNCGSRDVLVRSRSKWIRR